MQARNDSRRCRPSQEGEKVAIGARQRAAFDRRRSGKRNRAPDAAVVLAQIEIVRALRKADLHHILKGHPGAVGFVVDPADADVFAEAAQDMLKRASSLKGDMSYEVIQWAPGKSTGAQRKATEALRWSLTHNSRVIGIAAKIDEVPRFFTQAADAVLATSPVDSRLAEDKDIPL